jgi:hypothetical protein
MFIPALINECDITGKRYDQPVMGAYALARGATGRWCPVLSVGPEVIEEHQYKLVSEEEAHSIIAAKGDWLDY